MFLNIKRKGPTPFWKGREIIDESHAQDLERAAAIHEFTGGLTRDKAEQKAYDEYVQTHRREAAAHHYKEMTAAAAVGEPDRAHRSKLLYDAHVRALGHNPAGPPPDEIRMAATPSKGSKMSTHKADLLPLGKAELAAARLILFLRQLRTR